MGKWVNPKILIEQRPTQTGFATLYKLYSSLADEYDESTGLCSFSYDDGTTDESLPLGSIDKGQLLFISSDEEISIKINGGSEPQSGTLFLRIFDTTTGLTSLTISNASGSTANIEYLVAGDVTT